MKLKVTKTPYASGIGGGLMLTDETGRARFMVIFTGTTQGIEKAESDALAKQFADAVAKKGIEVPDRL